MLSPNVFDVETFNKDPIIPYCCCLNLYNKNYVFYGLNCLVLLLDKIFNSCYNNTIIYAHNLTFDGGLLINQLPENIEISLNHTSIYRCNIYSLGLVKHNKLIVFRCSAKILPIKLSEIAKIL